MKIDGMKFVKLEKYLRKHDLSDQQCNIDLKFVRLIDNGFYVDKAYIDWFRAGIEHLDQLQATEEAEKDSPAGLALIDNIPALADMDHYTGSTDNYLTVKDCLYAINSTATAGDVYTAQDIPACIMINGVEMVNVDDFYIWLEEQQISVYNPNIFLTIEEFMHLVGKERKFIYQLGKDGRPDMPRHTTMGFCHANGTRKMFLKDDVERWVKDNGIPKIDYNTILTVAQCARLIGATTKDLRDSLDIQKVSVFGKKNVMRTDFLLWLTVNKQFVALRYGFYGPYDQTLFELLL